MGELNSTRTAQPHDAASHSRCHGVTYAASGGVGGGSGEEGDCDDDIDMN
jgi:hypothetical protein